MITLAEEVAKSDPSLAPKLTEQALKLSIEMVVPERVVEALTEHSIALWNAGQRDSAYETLEMAVRDLLEAENESVNWKKLFLAVFHTVTCFGSISYFGHPPTA